MRQKTSLSLMELAVMVAVFALAAAICLRAFVWADTHSRRSQAESRAMAVAQTVAETVKSTHGDFAAAAAQLGVIPLDTGEGLVIGYDKDWNQIDSQKLIDGVDDSAYYLFLVRRDSDVSGLGKALVSVFQDTPAPPPDGNDAYTDDYYYYDDYLAEFYVAWQEEIDWGGDGQ